MMDIAKSPTLTLRPNLFRLPWPRRGRREKTVGADAEGQGEEGHRSEEGSALEVAQGVAEVLEHGGPFLVSSYRENLLIRFVSMGSISAKFNRPGVDSA